MAETAPGAGGTERSVGAELPGSLALDTRHRDHLRALWRYGEILGPSRCRSPAFLWALEWATGFGAGGLTAFNYLVNWRLAFGPGCMVTQ
jgi:hypothetical protein